MLERELDWLPLTSRGYERRMPDDGGILRSQVFPGLWLDPTALVQGTFPQVLAMLQQGLHLPAHQEFVQKLTS